MAFEVREFSDRRPAQAAPARLPRAVGFMACLMMSLLMWLMALALTAYIATLGR